MKVIFTGVYDGHTTKKDGTITLHFKAPLSELSQAMKTVMAVGKMSKLALHARGKEIRMGTIVFEALKIDRDGESKVSFNTDVELAEISPDSIRTIVGEQVKVGVIIKGENK